LAFDHRGQGYLANLDTQRRALAFARQEFWPRRFDLALLPRWGPDYYRSAFLAYFSGAATRIGYSEHVDPERRQLNRNWDSLLTRTIDDRKIRHEVQRNSDFLQGVGGSVRGENLEVWLGDQDHEVARHSLQVEGIAEQDLIITIAPGAGHAKRIWRLGLFVQLSRLLVGEFGARILIVGGTEDRDRGARLKEELGSAAVDFTGKTTMRQTAALLRHCTLTIANDCGPMHLAAAAGTAVVEISCHPAGGDPLHYNSPERFAPWCADRVVLQPAHATSPCTTSCEWHEAHCILNITTDQVMEAVRYLLARRTANKTTVAGN
jgi:heptosyltransferase-2